MIKVAVSPGVISLAILFPVLFVAVLRKHHRPGAFRVLILAMAADLAGIIYFLFGGWAAAGAVILGFIFAPRKRLRKRPAPVPVEPAEHRKQDAVIRDWKIRKP